MSEITLTPELQAAAAPLEIDNQGGAAGLAGNLGINPQSDAAPQTNANLVPAPQAPGAPAIPVVGSKEDLEQQDRAVGGADALSGGRAPLSFGERLAKAADELGIPSGPGGWAKSILGASMSALGDISAVRPVKQGSSRLSGAIQGIGDVMAAQTARKKEEEQQNIKNNQAAIERARQMNADERADQAWELQSKMGFLDLQQRRRNMDAESRKEEDDLNSRMFASAKENGTVTDSDLTGAQVQDLMKKNGVDYFMGKSQFITGRVPALDAAGKPMYKDGVLQTQPVYSFVQGGGPVTVDDKLASDIKEFAPQLKISAGTKLNKTAMDDVQVQVMKGMHTQSSLNEAATKLHLSDQQLKDIKEAPEKRALGEELAPYLEAHGNDVGDTVDTLTKISNQTIPAGQPNAGQQTPDAAKASDLLRKFNHYYGDTVINDAVKNTAKLQTEKLKEAQKKAAAGVQEPRGDTSLHGQAYLDSIEAEAPGSTAKLRLISNGQVDLGNIQRTFTKNPGVIDELAIYDPNFNGPAAKTFFTKTYPSYAAGTDKLALLAGSTAVDSLARLTALSTPAALLPGTEAHKRYEDQLVTAATETAKFLKGTGSPTKDEINEFKDKLRAETPYTMSAAARQQASAIIDRYRGYQNSWVAAFPSKAWNYPMPSSWDKEVIDRANALSTGKPVKVPSNVVQTQHVNLNVNAPGGESATPAQTPVRPGGRQQIVNPY